ncbi:MAG: methyltransferase domain-containing protein [Gammaproteobacteria bacterium]|nr:methyltransferase domain-containing protein [Gammaproteobacteria bacterium]
MLQNKQQEIEFFDKLADVQEYNVFTDEANQKIIDTAIELAQLKKGMQVLDLGCGSGIFTQLLQQNGLQCVGLDLSQKLLRLGKQQTAGIDFLQADVEALPFADNSVDRIMLSCLVHHLPNPALCAKEVFRVLKPGGRFVAFDPNRLNPFMYLYRDHSSPFYSSNGVTPNERPVLPHKVRNIFQATGLQVNSCYVDGLTYRYVASSTAKGLLPIYNMFERFFFKPFWMSPLRSFVFTYGMKP